MCIRDSVMSNPGTRHGQHPGKANHWQNYIGGRWQDSDSVIEITDPATDRTIGTIARADHNTVDQAVSAARACVRSGALTDCKPAQRGKWLYAIGRELRTMIEEGAELATRENGKALADSVDELTEAARYFEYYAGMADKITPISLEGMQQRYDSGELDPKVN